MGLFRIVSSLVGLLVLAVVFLAAYAYFTDQAVEATVTERGPDHVIVTPKLVPTWNYRVQLDSSTANVVCVGYEVEFHVQSHDLIVRDRDGTVVYSKVDGRETKNTSAALRCGASNTGGGLI